MYNFILNCIGTKIPSRYKNYMERKLNYVPSTMPFANILKSKVPSIPDSKLHNQKNKLAIILEGEKAGFRPRNSSTSIYRFVTSHRKLKSHI